MTTDATKQPEQFHVAPTWAATAYAAPGVAPCVNIDSLIAHFREELQRERDRVAVERTAASSAREALAACEERAKLEREGRLAALGDANRYAVERDNAVAELERYKATMGSASTVLPAPTSGTPGAVIEAYRLLVGHEPQWTAEWLWHDHGPTDLCDLDVRRTIMRWLDDHAPGGKP